MFCMISITVGLCCDEWHLTVRLVRLKPDAIINQLCVFGFWVVSTHQQEQDYSQRPYRSWFPVVLVVHVVLRRAVLWCAWRKEILTDTQTWNTTNFHCKKISGVIKYKNKTKTLLQKWDMVYRIPIKLFTWSEVSNYRCDTCNIPQHCSLAGVLQEIPTPKVNQFDLKRFWVDQEVLQLNVPVKYSSLTAHVSGLCCLCHDRPCCVLADEASLKHRIIPQIFAGWRMFQDHDVKFRLVLPVQQLNDLWNSGLLINKE